MVRRTMLILSAALLLALAIAVPAGASPAITGHHLWLNGERLGTVVVSSPLPNGGLDPIYAIFVNGSMFGDGIAAVGPGTGSYHGGAWAVHVVTFNDGYTPVSVHIRVSGPGRGECRHRDHHSRASRRLPLPRAATLSEGLRRVPGTRVAPPEG